MGSVWSWGNGAKGQVFLFSFVLSHGLFMVLFQLGFGDKDNEMQPNFINRLSTTVGIGQVSCGDSHSAVVDQAGNVWCWGRGTEG